MLIQFILSGLLATLISLQGPKAPNGSIGGAVLSTVDTRPISRATVILTWDIDGKRSTATATTDENGRFVFNSLAPGIYRLNAARNGFVPLVNRQLPIERAPSPSIELAPNQEISGVTLRLLPTGTLSGRVYDLDRDGLPNLQVWLLRSSYEPDGSKTLMGFQSVMTNDLGEYRLFGIPPGRYYVRADVAVNQTGVNGVSLSELGGATDRLVSTFFPGTIDESSATPINVTAGAALAAIDFAVVRAKTFRIRGQLISPVAPQKGNAISISLLSQTSGSLVSETSVSSSDLRFELAGVPPGRYYALGRLYGTTRPEANIPIEVTNFDIEGLNVVLSAGFPISGRLVTEGGDPGRKDSLSLSVAFESRYRFIPGQPKSAPVSRSDGTFTIPTVMPGPYQLRVVGLPKEYYVKSGRLGNLDVLRDGFNSDRQPDDPLDIVVSANAGKVIGTIIDYEGKPVPRAAVALLPRDRGRADLHMMMNADAQGSFDFQGLAPGEYKLVALADIEPGAQHDPDFIRKYEGGGTVVEIAEGSIARVQVRIREP